MPKHSFRFRPSRRRGRAPSAHLAGLVLLAIALGGFAALARPASASTAQPTPPPSCPDPSNGATRQLAPGESFTVNVAVDEGDSVQIPVTLDGIPVAGSPFTFTRDCEQPASSATHDCDTGGAVLTLSNVGPSPTVLSVTEDAALIDTVTVDGGTSIVRTYPQAEDQIATFRVTGPGGFDSGDLVVAFDCIQLGPSSETPVQGRVEAVVASRLAFTGGSTGTLAVPGAIMIMVGLLALVSSRTGLVSLMDRPVDAGPFLPSLHRAAAEPNTADSPAA
jgi:hypothetical protein